MQHGRMRASIEATGPISDVEGLTDNAVLYYNYIKGPAVPTFFADAASIFIDAAIGTVAACDFDDHSN